MIEVPKVIGAVVADIVRSAMTTPEKGRRPALRIAGFAHDEVVEILRALDEAAGAPATSPLVVKVGTASPIPGVNANYTLADGETLTGWRNAQVPALVLIDWDVQGDEEGLAALNRLDDVGVLSEQDPDLARQRFEKLIHHSWDVAGRGGAVPSRLLHDLEVVRSAVANSASLSLRTWTAYVATVCVSLANEALVTPDVVDQAVGGHLSQLDLFPDTGLFQLDGSGRTRLARNLRVSALRQPGGGPVTDEELLARIESTDLGLDLLRRFAVSADEARTRMRAVALGGGPSAKAALDLSLWLELFERRPDRAGLGKLIRDELARSAPERLDEFEELEVEAGLDSSEQEAAERLLRNESSSGLRTLADALPARLRRRLEKVAFPDAQVTNDPLRALLHVLSVLEDMPGEVVRLSLEGSDDAGEWSRWLFCLLWGPTLLDVVDRSSESPRRLELDPRLIRVPRPEVADLEEDFEPARAWAPLRLVVDVSDGGRRRFRWNPLASPGLVAFGALLQSDGPAPGVPFAGDLDSLCERFTDPRGWSFLAAGAPQLPSLPSELAELRSANLARMRLGLTADALDEYLEAWAALAERARDTLTPSNAPDPELAAVVLADIVELHEGRLTMLATHPLRLRWVARHLRRMTELLVRSLATGLNLNRENTELFFEWLDRASPHGTPPFIVGADETVAIPVREVDWHEEYAPIRRNGVERRDWLAAVDDAAIDEMVGVLATYLETYPYKQDGLVLLLLDREGTARLPLRIIQRLRARTPSVRVELHVLTPSSEHHEIVRAFEAAFADGEMGEEELFPDVQLMLRHWDPDSEPEIEDLSDRVDVALAPALFGTRTTLNRLTRERHAGISGRYDPWLHASTHDQSERSQNVVRVMLPSQLDPILETWSTLCVRHDAHSAVAPQQESNTDYFALQVRFDRHQRLFSALHRVAHWVVTLDTFIGRDQIDALEEKPDVILVRTGLGKNEAYTLIVSSGTGGRFVVARLTRKLKYDLGFDGDPAADRVARRIYEVGRNVVPGAVLRALGLGRAANEVVGLVCSRYEVARHYPIPADRPGLVVWISFDEHHSWFGRTQRTRADLGRFVLTLDDAADSVRLSVLVVESKFRQILDVGRAEQQLDRTTDLCTAAFRREDPRPDDADFWLLELAAAVDQTSRVPTPPSELPPRLVIGPPTESLEARILQSLRSGKVVLDDVSGVAVAIATQAPEPAGLQSQLGRHKLLRINRPEFERIVSELLEERTPSQAILPPTPQEDIETEQSSHPPSTEPHEKPSPTPPHNEGRAGRGIGPDELRARFERLIDTLSQHGVAVVPPASDAWLEGPGFYRLRVVPRSGVTVDRVVNRVDEISLALQLPAGAKIRTSLDRGTIVFEIPKAVDEQYPVLADDLWTKYPLRADRLEAPIGEDISGNPVTVEFSSPDSPHLLVAGTTGSGKSVALESILRSLCRYPADLVRLRLVDPKGTELQDFEGEAHTDGEIGMNAADALAILEAAVGEMQDRYQKMRPLKARSLAEYNLRAPGTERLPWIVIVLDEYADLTSDPIDKSQIEAQLRRLTQKARAAGIHVIAATQRPSADVVSTTIRSNFPAQLALRVKTATDSRIIMDEPGAEALAGRGDAFLRTARGVIRVQVAFSG